MKAIDFKIESEYQAAMAIAAFSHLAAYLFAGNSLERYLAVALGLNVLLLFLYPAAIRAMVRGKTKGLVEMEAEQRLKEVATLPLDRAKQLALSLLSNPARFRCSRGKISENTLTGDLGPTLQEFFSQFDTVEEVGGTFKVGRRWVGGASLRPGFIRIGYDYEGAEIVTRRGEDRVFIVHGPDHVLDGLPTIYHHILILTSFVC